MAEFISDAAEQLGFKVENFNNAGILRDAYDMRADIIVLGLMMPEMAGIETWVVLKKVMLQCPSWLDQGLIKQISVNMPAIILKILALPEKTDSPGLRSGAGLFVCQAYAR